MKANGKAENKLIASNNYDDENARTHTLVSQGERKDEEKSFFTRRFMVVFTAKYH